MSNTKQIIKSNPSQEIDTSLTQKERYEQNREKERKRRFEIESGRFVPITTNIQLKSRERAYFQNTAQRLADRESSKFYTTGKTRSPFIQGGLLRGNTKVDTSTIQQKITKNEVIDHGEMVFTDKRILFIGKTVVSLEYEDILTVEFQDSQMIIKYPQMLSGEAYDLGRDAKFYYQGLMRFLGRDKSKTTEETIDMSDYPEYVSDEEKEAKKNKSFTKNALIFIGICAFFTIFLRGVSMILLIVTIFVFLVSAVSFPVLYLWNRGTGEYAEGLQIAKVVFFWSIPLIIFCFILAAVNYH